jgi:hypothetical protein
MRDIMSEAYTIPYKLTDDVMFPTKKGMKEYLKHEAIAWREFLEAFERQTTYTNLRLNYDSTISQRQVARSLELLASLLETPKQFNNSTRTHNREAQVAFPPPPSTSVIGHLILGLWDNGQTENARCVFLWNIFDGNTSPNREQKNLVTDIVQGKQLFDAAQVVRALPMQGVSHQKLSAAVRSAETQVESLKEEVKNAQVLNADHDANLSEKNAIHDANLSKKLEEFSEDYQATEDDILSQQDALFAAHKAQIDALNADLEAQLKKYERQQAAYNEKTVTFENERRASEEMRIQGYNDLHALFHEQLKFKAPVELWGALSKSHGKKPFGLSFPLSSSPAPQ